MGIRKFPSRVFHTKYGLLLPALLIVAIIGVASASVFVLFFASGTATVRTPDISFAYGLDAPKGGSCSSYPCASDSIPSTNDFATLAISLFASATDNPQPMTYYTNLMQVTNNGTSSPTHTINSIKIAVTSGASNLGKITVYLCNAVTDLSNSASVAANCDSASVTSGSPSATITPSTSFASGAIAHGATGYVEVAAYAAAGVSPGATVGFTLQVSWA